MAERPPFRFDSGYWRSDPTVRRLSLAGRGLLVELLAIANEAASARIVGDADGLIRATGTFRDEFEAAVEELEASGAITVGRLADGRLAFSFSRPFTKTWFVEHSEYVRRDATSRYHTLFNRVGQRDGFRCARCGSTEHIELDHIRPVVDGGGNQLSNLQLLCKSCNCSKGATTIDYRQ